MNKISFNEENEKRPYLAVNAVFLKKINGATHILLGKRKNVIGAGNYYTPGGHVKTGELLKDTFIREVCEECGIKVKLGEFLWIEEAFKPIHHMIIYFEAVQINEKDEPKNVEPNKCEGWQWFPLDDLPKPLWHDLEKLIKKNRVLLEKLKN